MSLVLATLAEMYLGFDVSIWPVLLCGPIVIIIIVVYIIWKELLKKKQVIEYVQSCRYNLVLANHSALPRHAIYIRVCQQEKDQDNYRLDGRIAWNWAYFASAVLWSNLFFSSSYHRLAGEYVEFGRTMALYHLHKPDLRYFRCLLTPWKPEQKDVSETWGNYPTRIDFRTVSR